MHYSNTPRTATALLLLVVVLLLPPAHIALSTSSTAEVADELAALGAAGNVPRTAGRLRAPTQRPARARVVGQLHFEALTRCVLIQQLPPIQRKVPRGEVIPSESRGFTSDGRRLCGVCFSPSHALAQVSEVHRNEVPPRQQVVVVELVIRAVVEEDGGARPH